MIKPLLNAATRAGALILGKDAKAANWHQRPDCEIFNCDI